MTTNNSTLDTIGRENIKIGARILDDDVITNLLPNWKNIKEEVKEFRKQALGIRNNSENEESNSNDNEFYNVISILGKRGSGKTSVLRTIKRQLKHENDIILPLILPDKMSEVSDVLGWIIKLLENEMKKELSSENEDKIQTNCCKTSGNSLSKSLNRLKLSYYKRISDYRNIINHNFVGAKEFIDDKDDILNSDIDLLENFRLFIDECIICRKPKDKTEPLILIFFDDVDISAERCPEILKTIMCYLTHPNIVTFVSGELQVFTEILTIHFLKKEDILGKELMNNIYTTGNSDDSRAINLRRKRSTEYLKKIMPPTFRYSLEDLSPMQKGNYRYSKNSPTLFELITKIFCMNGQNNLIVYEKSELPYVFHSIFPDNPRSLINIYYFLYTRENIDWNHSELSGFLAVLYESKDSFQEVKSLLLDYIRIDEKRCEIDYESLETHYLAPAVNAFIKFEGYDSDNEKRGVSTIKEMINLIILGLFFKEIVKTTPDILVIERGHNYLFKYINKLSGNNNKSIVPIEDASFLLDFHNRLSDKLIDDKLFRLFDNNYSELNTTYLNSLKQAMKIKGDIDTGFALRFENWYYENKENKDWIEKTIAFIYEINITEETRFKYIYESFFNHLSKYKNFNEAESNEFNFVSADITKKALHKTKLNNLLLIEVNELEAKFNELILNSIDSDHINKCNIDEFEKYKTKFEKYIIFKNILSSQREDYNTIKEHEKEIAIQYEILFSIGNNNGSHQNLNDENLYYIEYYISEYDTMLNNNQDIWDKLINAKIIKYESCLTGKKTPKVNANDFRVIQTFKPNTNIVFLDIIEKLSLSTSILNGESGYLLLSKDSTLSKSVITKIKETFIFSEIISILKLLKPNDSISRREEIDKELKNVQDNLHATEGNMIKTETVYLSLLEELSTTVYSGYLDKEITPNDIVNKLKFLNSIMVILEDVKHTLSQSKKDQTFNYLRNNIEDFNKYIRSYIVEEKPVKISNQTMLNNILNSLFSYLHEKLNTTVFNNEIEPLRIGLHQFMLENRISLTNQNRITKIIYNLKKEISRNLRSYNSIRIHSNRLENNIDSQRVIELIDAYDISNYDSYINKMQTFESSFIDNEFMNPIIKFYTNIFSRFVIHVNYLAEKEASNKKIVNELYEYRKYFDKFLKTKMSRSYLETGFIGFLKKIAN